MSDIKSKLHMCKERKKIILLYAHEKLQYMHTGTQAVSLQSKLASSSAQLFNRHVNMGDLEPTLHYYNLYSIIIYMCCMMRHYIRNGTVCMQSGMLISAS